MSQRLFCRFIAAMALTLSIPDVAPTQENQTLGNIGAEILETIQSFYTVRATATGIHAYDHRLTDYSSKSVSDMVKKLTGYEKRLYKYKSARLSDYNRTNYQLLKSNVDAALLDLKQIQWHRKCPQLYVDEAINGIYYLILSNHAPLQERLVSILNRMKAVPGLFDTARKNLKKPPRLYITTATGRLQDGMRFYKDIAAELSNKFPERADELSRVSTQAREAMNDFMNYLSALSPGPESDIAIGKDNLDYKLIHEFFLGCDSDSLLKLGESLFEQANRAYHEYMAYVDSNHQNGSDSVFIPANFNKQDILDYYNWETDQVRLFLAVNNVLTIPETVAPITVIETPSFLRSMIGMYAYQPAGPFDAFQHGYLYVRPIPDDLDRQQLEAHYRYVHRRGFKAAVVHEAYPGHHLQMQLARQNPDPVRKWQNNPMMTEGWALYAEEMMYQQGLYGREDPSSRLKILEDNRFRVAALIADVKLHTGGLTFDECVDWMANALDLAGSSSREYLESEVRRYTVTPTQQIACVVGKLEILRLLKAARQRDGAAFSLQHFHDKLPAEGSIPPTLMWSILGLQPD